MAGFVKTRFAFCVILSGLAEKADTDQLVGSASNFLMIDTDTDMDTDTDTDMDADMRCGCGCGQRLEREGRLW